MSFLHIEPLEPLLFRDGRPFTTEEGAQSARTLLLPMPSTVAGFIRTLAGQQQGQSWRWGAKNARRVRMQEVHGPLLLRDREPVLPAPADAVVYEENGSSQIMPLRPYPQLPQEWGCNLPKELSPMKITQDVKPASSYALWPWSTFERWLMDPLGSTTPPPPSTHGLVVEERTHVEIDDDKGVAEEGNLFSTQMLAFESLEKEKSALVRWTLLVRAKGNDVRNLQAVGSLGGEKRLAQVKPLGNGESTLWPSVPKGLIQAIEKAKEPMRLRLILATPAIFEEGWKPAWLDENFEGCPPGCEPARLKLVGAAVKRHEAVSGWDFRKQRPKAVRWLAPAGSVYFFELLSGEPLHLIENSWLQPLSDREQDRWDGFGLALWGVWDYLPQ